jgi:phage-related holin
MSYLLGTLAYLIGADNFGAIMGITVLITIDLITAIMAEYKNGNPIESRKMMKTATKLVVYTLFLAAIHLTEGIVPGTTFLDEMVLAFLALTEAISVMENIGRMGYAVPLKLLNQLREMRNNEGDRRTGPMTRREDEIVIPTNQEQV